MVTSSLFILCSGSMPTTIARSLVSFLSALSIAAGPLLITLLLPYCCILAVVAAAASQPTVYPTVSETHSLRYKLLACPLHRISIPARQTPTAQFALKSPSAIHSALLYFGYCCMEISTFRQIADNNKTWPSLFSPAL